MSSINKISFGNGNSAPANILPSPLNDVLPYSSNDKYYRRCIQEIETFEKERLVKLLWPNKSPDEVKISIPDLKYMENVQELRELEEPIERSFKREIFVSNLFNRLKKILFKK